VAWKWQEETEVLGEKCAPVPLCPPQISKWTALSGDQPPDQQHAVLLTTMFHGAKMCNLGVNGSEFTACYGTTISEQWTGRDTEGRGRGLTPCSTKLFVWRDFRGRDEPKASKNTAGNRIEVWYQDLTNTKQENMVETFCWAVGLFSWLVFYKQSPGELTTTKKNDIYNKLPNNKSIVITPATHRIRQHWKP
jgi:hypothetical protein